MNHILSWEEDLLQSEEPLRIGEQVRVIADFGPERNRGYSLVGRVGTVINTYRPKTPTYQLMFGEESVEVAIPNGGTWYFPQFPKGMEYLERI